jgi:catechol 2,3-dioxygenase-like lactoylglutathione lyase family enzyme
VNRLGRVNLIVRDYDEALDFYTRKLGFSVVEDADYGCDRWLAIALPGASELAVVLNRARSEVDRALIGRQGGGFPLFGLTVDDCYAEYERMKALGVSFRGAPQVEVFGTVALLEDLYGNRITMNQEPLD